MPFRDFRLFSEAIFVPAASAKEKSDLHRDRFTTRSQALDVQQVAAFAASPGKQQRHFVSRSAAPVILYSQIQGSHPLLRVAEGNLRPMNGLYNNQSPVDCDISTGIRLIRPAGI